MSLGVLYTLLALVPNLREWAQISDVITLVMGAITGVWLVIDNTGNLEFEIPEFIRKSFSYFLIPVFITSFLLIVLPTNKQMLMIAGGYAVSNSADLKAMPENLLKVINTYFGELDRAEDEKLREDKQNDHK